MLMGADNGPIDIVQWPIELDSDIGLLLKCPNEALEDASLPPPVEAAGHGAPRAIALGQIAPRRSGAQYPQHAVEHAKMIDRWPTSTRFLEQEQRP